MFATPAARNNNVGILLAAPHGCHKREAENDAEQLAEFRRLLFELPARLTRGSLKAAEGEASAGIPPLLQPRFRVIAAISPLSADDKQQLSLRTAFKNLAEGRPAEMRELGLAPLSACLCTP